jgi:lipoprotein Spr
MRLKNLTILAVLFLFGTSCSTVRHPATTSTVQKSTSGQSEFQFIENVSTTSGNYVPVPEKQLSGRPDSSFSGRRVEGGTSIETFAALRFKYAILLNTSVEDINDPKLFQFIDEWYGISYHYGGQSKDGIDCSAFVSLLMSNVYGITGMPRVSRDQYAACNKVPRKDLKKGDLVFFHTTGRHRTITHVGFYLMNNKFVHASSSGVMISDLTEPYFAGHYIGAGRWPGI